MVVGPWDVPLGFYPTTTWIRLLTATMPLHPYTSDHVHDSNLFLETRFLPTPSFLPPLRDQHMRVDATLHLSGLVTGTLRTE